MVDLMLVVGGVEYRAWTPTKQELEALVAEHYEKIFGEKSLYFPVKTPEESLGDLVSIPDGYAIKLSEIPKWFVVEVGVGVELTNLRIRQISSQLETFIQGLKDPNNRRSIAEALYSGLKSEPAKEAYLRSMIGSADVYGFLVDLVNHLPALVVVVDEEEEELSWLRFIPLANKRLIEFKVFKKVDSELEKAFLLKNPLSVEPIYPKIFKEPSEYALPILEALIELGGVADASEVMDKVYKKVKRKLIPSGLEIPPDESSLNWWDYAGWKAMELMREGYLKVSSPLGHWEISEKGRKYYNKLKKQ